MITIKESITPPVGGYFTNKDVREIIIAIRLPKASIQVDINDDKKLSEIVLKLEAAAESCVTIRNLEDNPKLKEIKKELKSLEKTSNKFYLKLLKLSDSIKSEYLQKPYLAYPFFNNLGKSIKLLNAQLEHALRNNKKETKTGRPKINRVDFIIEIGKIYEDITEKEPFHKSRDKGRPSGPFFRYVKACLRCIGNKLNKRFSKIQKSFFIGDETIIAEIKKAKKLNPKYSKLNNPQ
jgi:hypothetical protein